MSKREIRFKKKDKKRKKFQRKKPRCLSKIQEMSFRLGIKSYCMGLMLSNLMEKRVWFSLVRRMGGFK